mgnify:CR=1 FL=1
MDYSGKFERIEAQTLYRKLDPEQQVRVKKIAFVHYFTLQELRFFVEALIDLKLWSAGDLEAHWQHWRRQSQRQGKDFKKWAFKQLRQLLQDLKQQPTDYRLNTDTTPVYRKSPSKISLSEPHQGKLFGMCPVQSEKTLCCNLYTIDAVKNCGFGCNYCSIQTLYAESGFEIDVNFADKLEAIQLDPTQLYHIGTGQSSDALMWGNRYGILDALFQFARKWPNVILEFKTKSHHVTHFLEHDVPTNIICSWSLNPQCIIHHEEPFTASLEKRLTAARLVADKGIRLAFHFHPMLYYQGWQADYTALITRVQDQFSSQEIAFISFGALTFPKPILRKIREHGVATRIHQTELVANPEGKLTYPDKIKEALFQYAYAAFAAWHDKVFFYLCMEESRFWEKTFGHSHADNAAFEQQLLRSARYKLMTVSQRRTERETPTIKTRRRPFDTP